MFIRSSRTPSLFRAKRPAKSAFMELGMQSARTVPSVGMPMASSTTLARCIRKEYERWMMVGEEEEDGNVTNSTT